MSPHLVAYSPNGDRFKSEGGQGGRRKIPTSKVEPYADLDREVYTRWRDLIGPYLTQNKIKA